MCPGLCAFAHGFPSCLHSPLRQLPVVLWFVPHLTFAYLLFLFYPCLHRSFFIFVDLCLLSDGLYKSSWGVFQIGFSPTLSTHQPTIRVWIYIYTCFILVVRQTSLTGVFYTSTMFVYGTSFSLKNCACRSLCAPVGDLLLVPHL